MPAPRYDEAAYDTRVMPTMAMAMQMRMQPPAHHQYYACQQPQYRHPPPPPSNHGYMHHHQSDWRLHESDVDARSRCEPMNSHAPSPNCSAPSPSGDGNVLPTLSTMLNTTWSSSPRWQPGEPTQQMSPAPRLGARRPGTQDLTVTTSPLLSSASGALNGRPSWGTRATAYDASHQIKTESAGRPAFSPIHDPTRKLSVDDEMDEDTNTDAMVSPRASCSSPSSYSTISEQPDGKCSSPVTKERKTSRYLREMDRRAILERLARGEKQATLAKEYHVSRAAICNLFKHRHEVMSRTDEDPFAKHPKKRKNKKTLKSRRSRSLRLATANTANGNTRAVVTPPAAPGRVHQVQSDAVLLLLTVMSDRRSSADEFRRASERVVWLLIEEALSVVPIKLTQVSINSDAKIMGVTTEHPPCAISMEQHSSPMLEVFQLLEPERPVGHIRIDMRDGQSLRLSDAQLPATLKYHNVFLFDVAVVSSDTLRNMIECVKERGALEVMIYVVALFISAEVVETLEETYPHVRIVTTQIESNIMESQKSRRSCVDVVLGRFDQVYQTQYTLV